MEFEWKFWFDKFTSKFEIMHKYHGLKRGSIWYTGIDQLSLTFSSAKKIVRIENKGAECDRSGRDVIMGAE